MRILNIGCGKDFSIGTDFADLYPARDDVKQCDMNKDKLPYEDSMFDEVYSQGMFEHLVNHENFMSEAFRVLKKGGKLTLRTDNASYFPFHIRLGIAYDHSYPSGYGEDDNHYVLFTKTHLLNWAKKFGFAKSQVYYSDVPHKGDSFIRSLARSASKVILPQRFTALHVVLEAVK